MNYHYYFTVSEGRIPVCTGSIKDIATYLGISRIRVMLNLVRGVYGK